MFKRQRSGAVLCPSCSKLVGVNDDVCLNCGRRKPGLWGFAPVLRQTGADMGFGQLVLFVCAALYLLTLAVDPTRPEDAGMLAALTPTGRSLLKFGASGAIPVFYLDRWWTVLSAGWLHGGVIHIAFNMFALRDLLPQVAHLYGPGRTVILYTVSCATGFLVSSTAGHVLGFLPSFLQGAQLTLGASASVFGMVGALAWYGRRSGSAVIGDHARRWVLAGVVFGFLVDGIDNWAHAGGFAGGWYAARFLDPLLPERGDHVLVAVVCLALSAVSIVVSLVVRLPWA